MSMSPEFDDFHPVENGMGTVDYPHQDRLTHQCGKCSKTFRAPGEAQRHMLLCDINGFRCPECRHYFKSFASAERHYEGHLGLDQYDCSLCGKTFTEGRNRDAHKKSHRREFQYKCSICDAAFRREDHRNKHEEKDHNGEHWNCLICGKWFIESGQKTKHIKWEHNPKRHNVTRTRKTNLTKSSADNDDEHQVHLGRQESPEGFSQTFAVSPDTYDEHQFQLGRQESPDRFTETFTVQDETYNEQIQLDRQESPERTTTQGFSYDLPPQGPILLVGGQLIGTFPTIPNETETALPFESVHVEEQTVYHVPQFPTWQRESSDCPVWVLNYHGFQQGSSSHAGVPGTLSSMQYDWSTGLAADGNHFKNQMSFESTPPPPLAPNTFYEDNYGFEEYFSLWSE